MGILDEVAKLKEEQDTLQARKEASTHRNIILEEETLATYMPEKPVESLQETPSTVTATILEREESKALVPAKTVKDGLQNAVQKTIAQDKDIKGLARDLTYLKGASDLQDNEKFTEAYQAELAKQLVEDLKHEGKKEAIIKAAKKEEARAHKQEAHNKRSDAYYNAMLPVFKILGIEASFGLVPMIITTVLLMIPYLVVCLITFIANAINKIFSAVAEFRKPAFWICMIILIGIITVACVLLALWGIDSVFGTDILKFMR